jgi:16S rRNA processing protein RimM
MQLLKIGKFTKPHGVKGEIGLASDYEIACQEDSYLICERDGLPVPFFIEGLRPKSDTLMLIKLEGVDSEAEAATFAGCEVFLPSDCPEEALAEDSWASRIGYALFTPEGRALGELRDLDFSTANVLLQVLCGEEERLIPAVDEWVVGIDRAHKRLVLDLPEGLLDL